MATYESVTYESDDGAQLGTTSTSKVSFWGAVPMVQPALGANLSSATASSQVIQLVSTLYEQLVSTGIVRK